MRLFSPNSGTLPSSLYVFAIGFTPVPRLLSGASPVSQGDQVVSQGILDLGPRPGVHGSETALRQCPGESLEGGSRRLAVHGAHQGDDGAVLRAGTLLSQLHDEGAAGGLHRPWHGRRLQLHLLLHGGDASVC